MEKLKNEYRVTWRLYRTWILEKMRKGAPLVFEIFWTLFGVGALVSGLLCEGIQGVLFLLMALFCFYRAFARNLLFARKQYRKLAETYGQMDWLRTISFEELEIRISEGTTDMHFAYRDIVEILEKQDEIRLVFRNKSVLRLYRDSFVNCGWEECRAWIEERSKESAAQIKY